MPSASVIIPTHNRRPGLTKMLDDLLHQEGLPAPIEVFVVDSPVAEDVSDVVEDFRKLGLDVTYLLTENNLAGKRNRGAEASTADVLIFADDDMRLPNDWVANHLSAQREYADTWVSGAVAFPADWIASSNYYRYKNTRHLNPDTAPHDCDVTGNHVVVMNMSMPKSLYLATGGSCEDFTRYGGEDVEFGFRFKRSGGRLRYVARALAYHHEDRLDVVVFARKLYVAAYTAGRSVLDKAPEAATVPTLRWTEPGYAQTWTDRGMHSLLVLLSHPALVGRLAQWLRKHDENPRLYLPLAYKALTLLATQLGVRDRVAGRSDRARDVFPSYVGS